MMHVFISSMEETLRTSQEGFVPTGFVKLSAMGFPKRKALSFVCTKIFTKYNMVRDTCHFENLFCIFSEGGFHKVFTRLLNHSTR
jgi:hypothetical protein